MASSTPVLEQPATVQEAAGLLRALGEAGQRARVRGGGTKLGWSSAGTQAPVVELSTARLDAVLEHNEGDFTAVLQTGIRLADAQERFAAAGQMLALDPPLGSGAATVGGVVASADSGPLRHRYGGVRDLVLGVQVVLSDGTVARSGGKVIKNVAGYDLGKLFSGSQGTLGLIAEVAVRLHPLAQTWATVRARSDDPAVLAGAAARLAALPMEADCLDVGWEGGRGEVLVRFAGATAAERAEAVSRRMGELGPLEAEVLPDDAELWAAQRSRQRALDGAVLRASGVIGDLERVIRAAGELGATVASRAGLGVSWVAISGSGDTAGAVSELCGRLSGMNLTVLDGCGPGTERSRPEPPPAARQVMSRLKARFDPAGVFPAPEWL